MNKDDINIYAGQIPNLAAKDFKSVHDLDPVVRHNDMHLMDIAGFSAFTIQSGLILANHADATESDKKKAYELICYGLGLSSDLGFKLHGPITQDIAMTTAKHFKAFQRICYLAFTKCIIITP